MINTLDKEVIEVALDDIIPNRFQPRLAFDEGALNELAKSIKEHGIIQPLVLRRIGNKYEIIAGERRYKAAYIAGLHKVPAVTIDLNDNESAEVAIVENIQRKDLSPIEEAKSYKKLLERGYLTQDELASRMGKTQGSISNKLRLLNLSTGVQDALLNNQISERHARSLLRIEKEDEQLEILNKIINERLNVRETDSLINSYLNHEEYTPMTIPNYEVSNYDTSDFETIFDVSDVDENNVDKEIEEKNDETKKTDTLQDKKDDVREVLQEKIRDFIKQLKEEGYNSTYDNYEFDNLYEFIIKVEK